jgi:hypothetical protein
LTTGGRCPHKIAVVAKKPKQKPAVVGDLDVLPRRLDKLEAKAKP